MFVPGAAVTARWVLSMVEVLSDRSAFVADLRAAHHDEERAETEDTPEQARYRLMRQYRAWTTTEELIARVGDMWAGKGHGYPRPGQQGHSTGSRVVVEDLSSIGL